MSQNDHMLSYLDLPRWRVVAETDIATPSSLAISIRAIVDLPAPEGLERT